MSLCFLLVCFLLHACLCSVTAGEEPICSKFMYDKQMIETMVRIEVKIDQWDKERKTFEENVLSILENRKKEMDEVVRTQNGKLEKERALFEENVSSILKNRKEEMDEVVRTQNGKLEKDRTFFEENVSSVLEHRQEEMIEVVRSQNDTLEKLVADFNDVRDVVRKATANMEMLAERIKDTPKVAFNAYTQTSGSYSRDEVFIFPIVLLNEAGGYNKDTGKFTAPISGLYHFHAHVCNWGGNRMIVSIVHGSETIARTTEYDNSEYSCGSVSAPAQVNKGDTVFITSIYSANKQHADQYRWPSFSGFLVNE